MSPRLFLAAFALASAPAAAAPDDTPRIPPVASLDDGVWMKGDLHLHSRHSTESTNNPVSKIIGFAEKVGMDFIALTDHDNHVLGDVAHHSWADPEYKSSSLVLLYGAEWTTHRGHGNIFAARPYDHQRLYDVRDARDAKILAVKKSLGVHLSANHPIGKDNFGFSYDIADSLEVWNSALWSKNANAIMIWDDMLKSGRKLTGRGGSDAHHGIPDTPGQTRPQSAQATSNYVGTPTTWVFARSRSPQAVVDALTNGRVSVSANPYAPRVEFYADRDGDGRMDMMMGDNSAATGHPVHFRVKLVGPRIAPGASYTVRVVKDGEQLGSFEAAGSAPVIDFEDTPARAGRTYYRVTVTGTPTPYPEVPGAMALSGDMIGLSNPIYFNFDPDF